MYILLYYFRWTFNPYSFDLNGELEGKREGFIAQLKYISLSYSNSRTMMVIWQKSIDFILVSSFELWTFLFICIVFNVLVYFSFSTIYEMKKNYRGKLSWNFFLWKDVHWIRRFLECTSSFIFLFWIFTAVTFFMEAPCWILFWLVILVTEVLELFVRKIIISIFYL